MIKEMTTSVGTVELCIKFLSLFTVIGHHQAVEPLLGWRKIICYIQPGTPWWWGRGGKFRERPVHGVEGISLFLNLGKPCEAWMLGGATERI